MENKKIFISVIIVTVILSIAICIMNSPIPPIINPFIPPDPVNPEVNMNGMYVVSDGEMINADSQIGICQGHYGLQYPVYFDKNYSFSNTNKFNFSVNNVVPAKTIQVEITEINNHGIYDKSRFLLSSVNSDGIITPMIGYNTNNYASKKINSYTISDKGYSQFVIEGEFVDARVIIYGYESII